jgi:hypothetical protein
MEISVSGALASFDAFQSTDEAPMFPRARRSPSRAY